MEAAAAVMNVHAVYISTHHQTCLNTLKPLRHFQRTVSLLVHNVSTENVIKGEREKELFIVGANSNI